jgi:IclR family acetate operon transcriptional repressor
MSQNVAGLATMTRAVPVSTETARTKPSAASECVPVSSPQLLERTFVVLSLFTPEHREWTVTELARACGLPVPTAYRIVSALHRNGFLSRHEVSKRYRLGPAIMRLGRTAAITADLRMLSRTVLQEIAFRTKETALLMTVSGSGGTAICVDRVDFRERLTLSVQPGRELPLHAGACQKMLLANLPIMDAERVLEAPLKRLCSNTITDPERLRQDLDSIRQRGWVASCEETDRGVWALAVGLIDEFDNSVAAIGVAGRYERKPRQLRPWLALLSDAAAEVAAQLGIRSSLTAAQLAKPPIVLRPQARSAPAGPSAVRTSATAPGSGSDR